jgi:hypothetical protein
VARVQFVIADNLQPGQTGPAQVYSCHRSYDAARAALLDGPTPGTGPIRIYALSALINGRQVRDPRPGDQLTTEFDGRTVYLVRPGRE